MLILNSVNSNFTLAVHSPKVGQAKTHNVCNINRIAKFQVTYGVMQGRASGMDCTLHTDLRESETSRDIKK